MKRVEENWSTYLFDAQGETVPLVGKMRLLYLHSLGNSRAFGKKPAKSGDVCHQSDDIIKIRVPRDTNTL